MVDVYTYFVVPYAEVTDAMVAQSAANDRDTLRHTVAGVDRVVMKVLVGEVPGVYAGYQEYDRAGINQLMTGADWKVETPDPY